MKKRDRFTRSIKIFGFLYFAFNFLIFIVLSILCTYTILKYQEVSMVWGYLLIPVLGMLSGYWIRTEKYGRTRSLIIVISLVCSSAFFYFAFVVGPQMDELKAEKFKKIHTENKRVLDEPTQRFFLGLYAGDINIVKEMLAKGVNVNSVNQTSQTPLHVTQNADIAKTLIAAGGNVSAVDDTGATPIFNKEVPIAGLLLDAGADIEARNENGNTPLLSYVYSGYLEGVKFLLSRGADINVCNADKHSALYIAKHFHPNTDLVRFLKKANVQACEKDLDN
jgi:hypothetical protein